ncbi:MAG: hypothetical protein ACI4FZ_08365 [Lachnospiraceae bacterium]
MKKIFFVTYGGVHCNIARFVYKQASENFNCEILALTVADVNLTVNNIPHNTLKDYMRVFSVAKQERIFAIGKELAKKEYNAESGIKYEDCVAYLGIGFIDLENQMGSYELAYDKFNREGRKAFCPVESMKKILLYVKPDIVVLTSNVRYERATGRAANDLGIPVLHIHDLPEMKILGYDADICVMNEYAKKYLIENDICNIKKIHVTGQPVFEDNIKVDNQKVDELLIKLDKSKYSYVIMYLEQPLNKDIDIIEDFLMEQARLHPENLYLVKLHPNQDYNENLCDFNSNYIKTKSTDLKALISIADVAITMDSNSGIEAALMGKNLIVVEINDKIRVDFSKYGIAIKASSIRDLEAKICLLQDKTSNEYIAMARGRDLFRNKENAANNIIRVIEEILIR